MVISFPESWSGKLGGTDLLFLVRLKCYKRETESLHCNLVGTDRSLRLDQNVTKGNREITIPIGRTDLPRVCGSGNDIRTRWRQIERIGVTDFGFRFRSFVDMRK